MGNAWYEKSWREFYARPSIVRFYESPHNLILLMKGGQRYFFDKCMSVADLKLGDRIADLCCGAGDFAIKVSERDGFFGIIHGVDLSEEMIGSAESRNVSKSLAFSVMDASDTTFEDLSFDKIFLVAVLHEMPHGERERVLREAWRILKIDGKLIVAEHSVSKIFVVALLQKAIFWLVSKPPERRTFSELCDIGLDREIADAGFSVETSQTLKTGLFEIIMSQKRNLD